MGEILSRKEQDKIAKLEAFWERAAIFVPFLEDPEVDEIAVNHIGQVDLMQKNGLWKTVALPELDLDFLVQIGQRLANFAHKSFDERNTSLSTKLPNGERVEMTHPPACPPEVRYLNIRKHTGVAFPHQGLIERGYYASTRHEYSISMTDQEREKILPLLADEEKELWGLAKSGDFATFMVKAIAYYQNIVISGATGSGKTSYMRALIELIDPEDRIITAEDTPEMPLPNHPHHNHLFYKKNESDEGATASDIMHSIMRKTPKRVLLAELRGDEAMLYLSGVLNSGHPGGLTTTHAGSPKEAYSRLALLILSSASGRSLDIQTILNLLYMTVNVVVQLKFDKKIGRHIPSIYYDPMYRLSLLG